MFSLLRSLVSGLTLVFILSACGGSSNDEGDDAILPFFPEQAFSEDFDSGTAGVRWECGNNCLWDVVSSGSIIPETGLALRGDTNFVFQSPDASLSEDDIRGFSCEGFSAEFEQAGSFAFDYYVDTAEPAPFSLPDGNYLEVTIRDNVVEFDPDFDDFVPISSTSERVLNVSGQSASRFQKTLPPGYYNFDFCYVRNRTDLGGPDFVQIDNVDTCVGEACLGSLPEAVRCAQDQADAYIPDSSVPIHIITVSPVEGSPDRYYFIVNQFVMSAVMAGLVGNPAYDDLRNSIQGLVSFVQDNGQGCDIDSREYVLLEMSTSEIRDFVTDSGLLFEVMASLYESFEDGLDADSAIAKAGGAIIIGNLVQILVSELAKAVVSIIL